MKRFRTCFVVQATLKTGNKELWVVKFFLKSSEACDTNSYELIIFGIYLWSFS